MRSHKSNTFNILRELSRAIELRGARAFGRVGTLEGAKSRQCGASIGVVGALIVCSLLGGQAAMGDGGNSNRDDSNLIGQFYSAQPQTQLRNPDAIKMAPTQSSAPSSNIDNWNYTDPVYSIYPQNQIQGEQGSQPATQAAPAAAVAPRAAAQTTTAASRSPDQLSLQSQANNQQQQLNRICSTSGGEMDCQVERARLEKQADSYSGDVPDSQRWVACTTLGRSDCGTKPPDPVVPEGVAGTGTAAAASPVAAPTALNQQCGVFSNAANFSCNTMSLAGLSASDGALAESALTRLSSIATSNSGGGVAANCGDAGSTQKAIRDLTAVKFAGCLGSVTTCISACQSDLADVTVFKNAATASGDQARITALAAQEKNLQTQIANCESYKAKLPVMMTQMAASVQGFQAAQRCVDAVKNSNLPPPKVDCTNTAYANVAPECICPKNPGLAICASFKPTNPDYAGLPIGTGAGTGGNTNGSRSGAGGYGGPGSGSDSSLQTGAFDPNKDKEAAAKTASGNNVIPGGGSGGPTAGGGGGGGGGGAGGDDGGSRPAAERSVITGLFGGGGGGGSSGGGGAFRFGSGSGGGSGLTGLLDKFSLKSLLPRRDQYKNRSLASVGSGSLQGVDGITGAMGPSIFEKVSNQYHTEDVFNGQ